MVECQKQQLEDGVPKDFVASALILNMFKLSLFTLCLTFSPLLKPCTIPRFQSCMHKNPLFGKEMKETKDTIEKYNTVCVRVCVRKKERMKERMY